MIKEKECIKFLSFPACIIATGIRGIIRDFVKRKWFDVIITTCGVEWSISLPYPTVESMKKHFPNSNILLGPGYTFGLYSCGDGLIKERGIDDLHRPIENGITEVFKWVGEERVYLMKRD